MKESQLCLSIWYITVLANLKQVQKHYCLKRKVQQYVSTYEHSLMTKFWSKKGLTILITLTNLTEKHC